MQKELAMIFEGLQDPRSSRNQEHPFLSLISIGLIGAVAGITSFSGLADFAKAKIYDLEKIIDLPNGAPSHDTFQRLFSALNADMFVACFMAFTQKLANSIPASNAPNVIALDGKTVHNSGKNKLLSFVSAWSEANQLVLGHVKVDGKSNEITAIPVLLKLLDLHGAIVTIDAIGCQREISQQIVVQQGDYVLAVKGNQKSLFEDIKTYFEKLDQVNVWEEYDKGHGRIEKRSCYVTEDIEWLRNGHQWPGLKTIGMVVSQRTVKDKTSTETRFYISSLPANAELICKSARLHWGIENKLHWRLDVLYNQDSACIRDDNAVQNMDTLHKWALNVLSPHKGKLSIKSLQRQVGYSFKFMLELLRKIFHA